MGSCRLSGDEVRAAVARFPSGRRYRLCDQLVSAADSIAANISEGSAGQSIPERLRFYRIALGSAQETLTFLKRARNAKLMDTREYFRLRNLTAVTHSMLEALIRKLDP